MRQRIRNLKNTIDKELHRHENVFEKCTVRIIGKDIGEEGVVISFTNTSSMIFLTEEMNIMLDAMKVANKGLRNKFEIRMAFYHTTESVDVTIAR